MERSLGMIGVGAVVVVLLAGVLGAAGGTEQAPLPAPDARLAAPAEVADGSGARTFSSEARRRAMLDREWHEALQGRCVVPSAFAAPAAWAPAC